MDEIVQSKDKAQSWRELIEAQVQSGQAIHRFCESHQIKKHTFYYWKQKLRRLSPRFIPISKVAPIFTKSPRIYLPNGVQIELGAGLESGAVSQLIQKLCGVNNAKS